MCERIPDPEAQSRLKVLMALHFAEVSPPESIIKEVLGTSSVVIDTKTEIASNQGVQLTASSVRSSLAPASGSS